MDEKRLDALKLQAARIRKTALRARQNADSGHIGGSYSIVELLTALYFEVMRIDPQNPRWPDRDRFVLSKGHCTPAAYAALAWRGYFPIEKFEREFRQLAFRMSGHMEMNYVPGVDMSTGSLGQGISAAVGMALCGKTDGKSYRTYCIVGDGELQEGQVWEAAMTAGFYHLDNLTVIVDNNKLQLDGPIADIMDPNPIDRKFEAFGFRAFRCDGHDIAAVCGALAAAAACRDRPSVLVADTVKGKGVSVFENNNRFHGGDPTAEEYAQAYRELDAQIARLGGEN
jgi:transketolase